MLARNAAAYFKESAGGKGDECIGDAARIEITLALVVVGMVAVAGGLCRFGEGKGLDSFRGFMRLGFVHCETHCVLSDEVTLIAGGG